VGTYDYREGTAENARFFGLTQTLTLVNGQL
jgi:hypothetical protein